jgi:hypothetical protein
MKGWFRRIMATTDLKLDEPGSLPRPGPIGRVVRLLLGLSCGWYVVNLLQVSGNLTSSDGHVRPVIWNGIIIGLFLVSYVVNIGFSRAWNKRPALVSACLFLMIAGVGYILEGSIETIVLARVIWIWELYVFSHLGLAFILASLIGTPGCEMRAFHDLYSRTTGKQTKEHFCPVGPLNSIDKWEVARSRGSIS